MLYRDPAAVVLHDPEVPEDRRFCGAPDCGRPVGRSRDGRPGRTEGFCPHDGTPFSFTPKLREGDLVAGQYEVKGCLAHGGLGWVYLAADRNLDGRWVVLKGLLNTNDAEALAVAEAERRFLTGVDHPNIVKIFNFVRHREPGTGPAAGRMAGYLVMEYIGGESLHDLLRRRLRETGAAEALPLRQAIPYALEILRALGYLHERGMLYCDLKPANVIQVGRELKIIDLGAVRMIGDSDSAVYGTVGYQAPEISSEGPSVASDLYTVGRTLAVLSIPFSPVSGGAEAPVPALEDLPPGRPARVLPPLPAQGDRGLPRRPLLRCRGDGRPAGGGPAGGARRRGRRALPGAVRPVRPRADRGRDRPCPRPAAGACSSRW
ncbi:protein kinase domain-containing protein, partial [Planomonospora algeriensis]